MGASVQKRGRRRSEAIDTAAADGGVGHFPYTRSFLTDEATRSAIKSLPEDFIHYNVDLTGFFAPHHPWLAKAYELLLWIGIAAVRWWPTPAFLGYFWIFLLLMGGSLFFKKSELRLWIAGWTVFLLLCLGPYLEIHGLVHTSFILPVYFFSKLPLLESTGTSSRFLVPLVLLSITIGCLLLKEFFQKTSGRQRTFLFSRTWSCWLVLNSRSS